ncbi:acyl-CoA synthetase, putative [Plasmodium sp. gorilla clade G1]|nr:acyl-CoA synthetase, putative [Plasmodium sp. gorilla clade G1]
MNIILCLFSFFIYIFYLLPCHAKYNNRKKRFAEICKSAGNKNESCVYRMNDYKMKSSLYKYKHLMNIFLDKYKLDNNKLAIVENCCGEAGNSITYGNFFKKVLSFSHSLKTYEGTGIPEKVYNEEMNNGKFRLLGLYGNNSTNWLITDLACMMSGVTTLVIQSKFSIDIIIDILNNSKLEWLCLDLDLVEGILCRKNELPYLKKLIILDNLCKVSEMNLENEETKNDEEKRKGLGNISNEGYNEGCDKREEIILGGLEYDNEKIEKINALKEKAKTLGLSIIVFDNMTNNDIINTKIENEDPNFIASIVYTSGTSGKPKGAMLSNRNFYNSVIPISDHNMLKEYCLRTHLSYLPVSHVYERIMVLVSLILGIKINIWSRDIKYLNRDICNSNSEIIFGVPKIFSRMYTNIMTEINNLTRCKKWIAKQAINLRKGNNDGGFSKVVEGITAVSSKIKDVINPNMRVVVNGGGKLCPNIASQLRVLLNIKYFQGYGLTELAGPSFLQDIDDNNTESMGVPVSPSTKYKVRTWETYKATDTLPKGELLIKSDSMFSGYFLEKECTKNAFTDDGYFKTGDIVQINDNGSVTFLDRSKGLVKLSQGEYIETDMLNNLYSQITFVNFCVVYGDDSMDGPLGIISVDKYLLFISLKNDNMLEKTGVTEKNYSEKLIDETLNETIYIDYVKGKMMEIYKKTNLNRYNVINDIYITSKQWDTTNYLTPTFKIKRFNVFKDFSFYIDAVKKKYEDKLKGSTIKSMNNGERCEKKDDIKNGSDNENKRISKSQLNGLNECALKSEEEDVLEEVQKTLRKYEEKNITQGVQKQLRRSNGTSMRKAREGSLLNSNERENDINGKRYIKETVPEEQQVNA